MLSLAPSLAHWSKWGRLPPHPASYAAVFMSRGSFPTSPLCWWNISLKRRFWVQRTRGDAWWDHGESKFWRVAWKMQNTFLKKLSRRNRFSGGVGDKLWVQKNMLLLVQNVGTYWDFLKTHYCLFILAHRMKFVSTASSIITFSKLIFRKRQFHPSDWPVEEWGRPLVACSKYFSPSVSFINTSFLNIRHLFFAAIFAIYFTTATLVARHTKEELGRRILSRSFTYPRLWAFQYCCFIIRVNSFYSFTFELSNIAASS